MNWLDIIVLVILATVTAIEAVRGFGRAVMDALCLYGALWLSNFLAPSLAGSLHFQSDPAKNLCIAYGLLLLTFCLLGLAFAHFLHQMTLMDAGMFDRLFGITTGIIVGMMAAHGFLRVVSMSFSGDPSGEMLITSSFLGNEMLSFTTYHSLINTLTATPSLRRQLPS